MHPLSMPANSTLPPVQKQKKKLVGEKDEEEEDKALHSRETCRP